MAVGRNELEKMNENFAGKQSAKLYNAGLLTNVRCNSGSRIILVSQQMAQYTIPKNAQFPPIYTGFENAFGDYADSVVRADGNYRIVDVISKYLLHPRHIYYYVVQDVLTGKYDVIEIQHYIKYSETHGFFKEQIDSDLFMPGMVIPQEKILSKAASIDQYGNYCMGVRANMAYISLPASEEDGFVVSDEFAAKTTFYQIEESLLTINNNTVLLNLYGNRDNYKAFPDLFEDVRDGILCTRRQVNFSYAASELTENALSSILDNDKCIPGQGKVIDIDVYINDEEELLNNSNRTQIMRYWVENKNFHKKIVDTLGRIVKQKSNIFSYKLKLLYERSLDYLNPEIKFATANGTFEFALIKFTTAYETQLREGYKIVDRHGSKGVICHVIPKEYMPVDIWGTRADIIQSPPSIIGRANVAQSYEHELNFISTHVRRLMAAATPEGVEAQFQILYEYIATIDLEQGTVLKTKWRTMLKHDKLEFIASCINDAIYIRQAPFSGNITFETMDKLYTHYDIHPQPVRMKAEFKKHGFSANIDTKSTINRYFPIVLNSEGQNAAKGISPYTTDEDIIQEISDDKFKFPNEGYIPGVNGNMQLVSFNNETKEVKQLAPLDVQSFEDKLLEHWLSDTITEERNDTIVRSFLTKRPIIISEKYFLILKHIPEGKLSARYIGTISALGMPNKPAKNENTGFVNQSPIKVGEMELFNMFMRIPAPISFRYLSQISKDPEMRNKLFNILLYKDPLSLHNITDNKNKISGDIPPKVLHAFLMCMGLEIIDKKEDDIYTEFDAQEFSDEELERIMALHYKLNPPVGL